ncbi:MAG TPA: hypothetical protein VIV12_11790 [Streptosporangiaceae bacterium]
MQDTTSPTMSTPPRRPHWPRRHPVLTTLAAVAAGFTLLIIALGVVFGAAVQQATQPNHITATHAAASQPAQPAATQPAQPAGPQTMALGDTAVISQDGRDAAHITVARVTTTTQPADPEFGMAPQNGWFVIVHIRARALGNYSGGFDVNPFDFYARAGHRHYEQGNGNAFDALPMSQNTMDAVTLNAGESTSGVIVFDLPSPHGKIAYAPNFEGGPLGYWSF